MNRKWCNQKANPTLNTNAKSVMIFFTFFNLVCTGYFTMCNVTYLTGIRSKSSKPLF